MLTSTDGRSHCGEPSNSNSSSSPERKDKMAAAGLFFNEDYEMNDEEMAEPVDNSLDLNRRFLIEQKEVAIKRYKEYLEERLINGNGEAMVEVGAPIDCEDDAGYFLD